MNKPAPFSLASILAASLALAIGSTGIAWSQENAGSKPANSENTAPLKDSTATQNSMAPSDTAGAQQGKAGQDTTTVLAPVVMLVPVQVSTDPALGKGCWAQLFDGHGYSGSAVTLVGPVDIADTETRDINLEGEIDSIVVGPKARLVVFDEENFGDKDAAFGAGERVPDTTYSKLGFFDDIESLRLSCPA